MASCLTCGLRQAFIPDVTPDLSIALFKVFAFALGACIGSFLNVVIYRLPLGLSVNEPRRSFCPNCKKQIPFSQNVPLLSWLLLRGKCAQCGGRIAFRYFMVELLTGLLFLAAWIHCDRTMAWALAFPLWVFIALLVAATFIDLDHFIIPDEITIGGTVAGLGFSFAFPSLMGVESHGLALLWSVVGAVSGYALLWVVVEAGKLAFGKRKLAFDPPASFRWVRQDDDADFTVGDETLRWSDIFSRESDLLTMDAVDLQIDEQPLANPENRPLRFFYNRLLLPGKETEPVALDSLATIAGTVRQLVIPREAMGFGDVKFIACIGAFLGWKAVLFTIAAASMFGSVVGVGLLLLGRREASGRIPFGPYLTLGALAWIFIGPALIHWYLGILAPA